MVDRVRLTPPKGGNQFEADVFNRLGSGPFLLRGYAVASLPSPAQWGDTSSFSSLIYIYNETGGATLAFSDGTNWRRVQDRAIAS